MDKIKMTTPLVEMDGDEMTRVIWQMIKDELILPHVDLKTVYYDLGLKHRDDTGDQVTHDSAEAVRKYGVAVKCATITPNAQRMSEYSLREMWKSPNATIRGMLDGTIFRAPIVVDCIKPAIPRWTKPITIARHAYGDIYKGVEISADEPGTAELIFTGTGGKVIRQTVAKLTGPGILQGIHNTAHSLESFAHSCFKYAAATKQSLLFSAKDTISKTYDGTFKEVFEKVFADYRDDFGRLGLTYTYTLIDDAVSYAVKSNGGYIWALKNYDGDVMSDMVSTVYGSLSMMTSVLVSPDGKYEYEAAHGTVTRHYYRYLNGEEPSTNPVATIFAWSGALKKRGELDSLPELVSFGQHMEDAVVSTINSGLMTKDLAPLAENAKILTTREFIAEIAGKLS